ncbi:MAG: RDD family protein [Candidatus Dormibacteria bacterium]
MNGPRETMRVSTADNVALAWDVAGLGSRLVAQVLDGLIVGAVDLVAAIVVLGAAQGGGDQASLAAVLAVVGVLTFVSVGYFVAFEAASAGRTPGKAAMGLRVITVQGGIPTMAQFLIRNVARLVDTLAGVGIVVMFINRQSRRVGDLLAGTLVVHARPAVTLAAAVAPPPILLRALDAGPALDNLGRLGQHELTTLRTFLSRSGVDPAVRARLAADIAQRLVVRLDLPPGAPERLWPPELLIERVYLQLEERGR